MKWFGLILPLAVLGCELAYPEVVVTNLTAETIVLRNVSFNGCAWAGELAHGDSTSPGRCLPGEDRVHFQKLDLGPHAEPLWFNYQTVHTRTADYGEFHVFEITLAEWEQDFSVPGPYGH